MRKLETRELPERGEIHEPVDATQVSLVEARVWCVIFVLKAGHQQRAHARRHGCLHLEPNDFLKRAADDFLLDTREQVARRLEVHVSISRDAEEVRLANRKSTRLNSSHL